VNPTDVAAEALAVDPAAILSVERIKGGLTNDSWVARTIDRSVVVRLSNAHEEELQIDRAGEARILSIVADAGIGVPVVLCAPERRLLVTRYMPGMTWAPRDARSPHNLQRLAELLQRLHSLPVSQDLHRVDLQKILSGYWRVLMEKGAAAQAGTAQQRERATSIAVAAMRDARPCLCHNDVHHLNVVDDGRLWLVDWEYAGIGDPYFDLASACSYHGFSEELKVALLRAYLGVVPGAALERLQQMCWLFDYIRDLWFSVRETQSGT
jgi:thiamine kinase